jgi:ubiquinone/menaquinone biosynthesis C-methylase UbiE
MCREGSELDGENDVSVVSGGGKSRGEATKLNEESERWLKAFRSPVLLSKRQRKHREKLKKLGVYHWARDAKIIDMCCGTGELLHILHDEGFTDLHGVDVTVDSNLVKEAWISLTAADCRKLPYADNTFDSLLCMHALHHMGGHEGVEAALKEALRILKPGGRLALIDFYDSPWLRFTFWCFRQRWLTWVSTGIRNFGVLVEEEWSYLKRYLDQWPKTEPTIKSLPCDVEVSQRGIYFFYWVGKKK